MFYSTHNLKEYNTFGIDVTARYFARPQTVEEAKECLTKAHRLALPVFILGGGSNVLFTKDFEGLIISPAFMGIEVQDQTEDKVCVAAGAGVTWDDLVAWCVNRNWGGLENLSHIPGTVGAAPVQNIGAYGAEAKDVVSMVEGIYIDTLEPFRLPADQCAFGYRSSIFKHGLKGQTLITRVSFTLTATPQPNTDYGRIEEELQNQPDRSIQSVRRAVIAIRSQKLPDPKILGNAGSFFKNPAVKASLAKKIQEEYPNIPIYPSEIEGHHKLPAAFLIEKCGWKGVKRGNVGVHKDQPLVLVAFEGAKGHEVLDLSTQIESSIQQKFGIQLDKEVNVL
ncbi:MAG: UDP-N-acetylmuramate dehydrogenase [Bacteroidales bacterium]|nr:UDP-N-acetylmuramate dehydrogenase [Bacteroidales bacterium]